MLLTDNKWLCLVDHECNHIFFHVFILKMWLQAEIMCGSITRVSISNNRDIWAVSCVQSMNIFSPQFVIWRQYIQSGAVITWYNIIWFFIWYNSWGQICIRGYMYIHKWHTIPRLYGRAMGCVLWGFGWKLAVLLRHRTVRVHLATKPKVSYLSISSKRKSLITWQWNLKF